MNYRAIIHYAGTVLKLESAFLLLPLLTSLYHHERGAVRGLLVTGAITLAIGLVTDLVRRVHGEDRTVHVKDGLVLTAVCWLAISLFGALPFYLGGAAPSFVDCLYESVSGFTTTGSSIFADVESLPRGLLLWRSLSHWIGGMGVLVFLLAIGSNSDSGYSVHVMKAESPGPAPGKLVPRLRQSSKILYSIYLALTLAEAVFLLCGGMPLFDSVCIAMSTAGTGGFAVTNASIAAYNSIYIDVVVSVFMLLFGVNFNVYYFLLVRNFKGIWHNSELKAYLGIFAVFTLLITWNLTGPVYDRVGQSLYQAVFQVGSVFTTTGFSTADFSLWPGFSKAILLTAMMTGACAGSTSGGLKVSRAIIIFREVKRLLTRHAHPRVVGIVKMDGKAVDKAVVHGVNVYVITLLLITTASILLVSLDNLDFETTVSAVIASISNTGAGLGLVSPSGNYAILSPLSKAVLMLDMLLGRLEIYPILLLLTPRVWRKV